MPDPPRVEVAYAPRRARPEPPPDAVVGPVDARIAWWEWPFVVVLVPIRWAGTALDHGASHLSGLADRTGEALARGCRAVLRPVGRALHVVLRPGRWCARRVWSGLAGPRSVAAAAVAQLQRRIDAGLRTVATGVAVLARPLHWVVVRLVVLPAGAVVRAVERWWVASGWLRRAIWRRVRRPLRWVEHRAQLVGRAVRAATRRAGGPAARRRDRLR